MDSGHHNGALENYYGEPDLDVWFMVSGDMDDFIFYDEPDRIISEK